MLDMVNFSTSEENYLKAIYHLQCEHGTVATNVLADELKSKPASITDMMKKLSAKHLLNYKPYYGFTLSAEGKRAAIMIIRRHRLWEFFLAEKLGFGWNEVHTIAEELEHVSSRKLIDRLDEYLGFPAFDPHGDPIPNSKGKMQTPDILPLSELALNLQAKVSRVANKSDEMLELLQEKHIRIGTIVEVKKKFAFDHSLQLKTAAGKIETISELLAKNIFVKP
jgi:DtxR family transcriptional regulator, Mn-dependent transcriptional regulator